LRLLTFAAARPPFRQLVQLVTQSGPREINRPPPVGKQSFYLSEAKPAAPVSALVRTLRPGILSESLSS
jgi:hypothetical protein